MGFYQKYVFPRLIELAMSNADLVPVRQKVVSGARGVTVELGIGSGLNLPHYGSGVTQLFGVEPSPELAALARRRAAETGRPVELLQQSAEQRLPLPEASVDTVVVTWALCSIPDPVQALREARRVLRREGELLFVEHGRADDPRLRRWQDRLNPLWKVIAGGCNMNRAADEAIQAAGFRIQELTHQFLPGPKLLTYTYQGRASVG
ncbi:MAG TPA: class I SAM-dependent methyltransferase [Myxococcota bacterium]|nr:class I SAM-dependent methyltransferase [Myxococcota bacterium]